MQLKYSNYVAFSHDYGFAVNNSGLICGEVSIYEVETIEMSHKWVNGACVYCNKGYAKEIN